MFFQNHKHWKCWQWSFAVIAITEWKTEFIEYLQPTPSIFILFYFSQSSSEWYVLAMQCTILLFCFCFITILSQYQVMLMDISYWNSLSNITSKCAPHTSYIITRAGNFVSLHYVLSHHQICDTVTVNTELVQHYWNESLFNFSALNIKVNT